MSSKPRPLLAEYHVTYFTGAICPGRTKVRQRFGAAGYQFSKLVREMIRDCAMLDTQAGVDRFNAAETIRTIGFAPGATSARVTLQGRTVLLERVSLV